MLKQKMFQQKLGILLAVALMLAVGFQNCADTPYNFSNEGIGSSPVETFSTCVFNGGQIPHLGEVTAYEASTVDFGGTCKSEKRICNNGTLSGSFVYSDCEPGSPAACMFVTRTIPHGKSIDAFEKSKVSFGQKCVTQSRTCNNGSLSGDFVFDECQPESAVDCKWDNKTVLHGDKKMAWKDATVPPGQNCVSEERVCTNGVLSGTYQFANCEALGTPSCTIFGKVNDAATKLDLQGVTVAVLGKATASATTGNDGQYKLSKLSCGAILLKLSRTDYISLDNQPVDLSTATNTDTEKNFSMTQHFEGRYRIVLNWTNQKEGAVEDVDSYLKIPKVKMPIFYNNRGTGYTATILDVDDKDWIGPETITIKDQIEGEYIYYINNFTSMTDLSALGNSNVKITLYKGKGTEGAALLQQYELNKSKVKITIYNGGSISQQYEQSLASPDQGISFEVFRLNGDTVTPTLKYNDTLPIAGHEWPE